jgi:hypothetical protein
MTEMQHTLSRCAFPPLSRLWREGAVLMARQSRFHGTLGLPRFSVCGSRFGAMDN